MRENVDVDTAAESIPETDLHRLVIDEFLDIFTFGKEKLTNYVEKLKAKTE